MKEISRYGFTLTLICMAASGLLAGVNFLTQQKIIAQARSAEEAGLKEVLPQGDYFEEVSSAEEIIYYKAYDQHKNLIGAVFKVSAKGYSSQIEALVGVAQGGTITAVKILSQNETPGLGSRITEPAFLGQFMHKNTQGLNQVQAITGATISSKAVIEALKKKIEETGGFIKNER